MGYYEAEDIVAARSRHPRWFCATSSGVLLFGVCELSVRCTGDGNRWSIVFWSRVSLNDSEKCRTRAW